MQSANLIILRIPCAEARNANAVPSRSNMFNSLEELEDYIKEEFIRFNISNWEFRWNKRATATLGQAFLHYKRIELSLKFVIANFDKPRIIRDIILHEIAHALAYIHKGDEGHGKDWIYYCNITGARPTRLISEHNRIPRNTKLVIQDNNYSLSY